MSSGRPRPATIKDVAAAAGVSTATVSKFINGQQGFSGPVEARLKAVIEELGYRQNPLARGMATGRTSAIGLAVMDIGNPHHASLVKGANRIALANGYNLLVIDLEERPDKIRQLLEALALRVDGMIVSSRIPDETIDWLNSLGKPVVFAGRPTREGIVAVRTDSYLGATILGSYLVKQGYKRIAYAGFDEVAWNSERLRGLSDTAKAAGVELLSFNVGGVTTEAGERAASRILLGHDKPDVVVGCNDQVAIGLMLQARELGLSVPRDVAIAGFDNIPPSRYVSLTTVDMCSEQNGEKAMQYALTMIEGKPLRDDLPLEPRLFIRNSTGRQPID